MNLRGILAITIIMVLSLTLSPVRAKGGEICDLGQKTCRVDRESIVIRTAGPDLFGKDQGKSTEKPPDSVRPVLPSLMLVKGSSHASITIIEYSDFLCSACARAAKVLDEVTKAYPDEIRVVFKHYPSAMNPHAILAHEAALAAGEQGKFWEMHDRLFAHKGVLTPEILERYAKELGLETEPFVAAVEDHRFKEIVVHEIREARGFGVSSVPTFFINGRKLVGSRSLNDFKQIIDEELGLTQKVQAPRPKASPLSSSVKVNIQGAPVRGPEDAPIVIVEFSDFQCPFCARVLPTLKELMKRYPTQVRWAFKHFPLSIHPDAPLAHEAALAAKEQGKFWEMHDRLFLRQKRLKRPHLLQHAKDLGLDLEQFTADLDSGRFKAMVEQDLQEGRQLGIRGTPTFFVNGERLVGARPMAEFVTRIEKQLRTAGVQPSKSVPAPTLAPPSPLSTLGPSSAPVQIEAFIDLASPLSAQTLQLLNAIWSLYSDEVRIAIRHLPQAFHPDAPLAHQAALAAGEQGKYWEMQERILSRGGIPKKRELIEYARQLKLNQSSFTQALKQRSFQSVLDQDHAVGLQKEVRGVPTLFVNGKKMEGIPEINAFAEWIDKERRASHSAALTGE